MFVAVRSSEHVKEQWRIFMWDLGGICIHHSTWMSSSSSNLCILMVSLTLLSAVGSFSGAVGWQQQALTLRQAQFRMVAQTSWSSTVEHLDSLSHTYTRSLTGMNHDLIVRWLLNRRVYKSHFSSSFSWSRFISSAAWPWKDNFC